MKLLSWTYYYPLFKKKLIIAYSSGSYHGAINICSTFNAESIVEVIPCDNLDLAAANSMDSSNNMTYVVQSRADEALKKVTALFYDEEHHRIYTGNTSGVIHVWST
jgi:NAD(P)H-dependent FMN reductase